jgi:hypothetical protein
MDKSSYIPGPEYTATIITPQQMISDMEVYLRSTYMNTIALPPMTNMALQLMVNPPKMSTKCAVLAHMVAQLTR